MGSGYLYETTFEKEVYSDLTGERGILMGAIYGLFRAQYDVLRAKGLSLFVGFCFFFFLLSIFENHLVCFLMLLGHSPSEAFNETVEEATQSLYPLIGTFYFCFLKQVF